ncbi:hypothetical protein EYC59_02415 [Candidatus Saccharibacteria bacterium]|nr:MAG: hypothetical protein EYC59_02415 [Candidatus Saccharibacteria bacterium]
MKNIEDITQRIKAASLPVGMSVKIVAVDGHGGSGKSTLAERLSKELGAEVVHTDDFASWDNTLDWWPSLKDKVLEPIKNGAKTLNYNRSSWASDHHPEPVVDQPVTPIIILEGVSSARKEFRPYLSFAIWVETPVDVCMERGLARDGQPAKEQWLQWLADEDIYIARDSPQEYANLIVKGTE